MTYHRAYYSLVQFCPDRGKAEAANIGVLLLCPDLGFADLKIAKSNERIRKFFGRESFDEAHVQLYKDALEVRVREKTDWSSGLEDLERFIGTRANDILLTPARPMKTADPVADLSKLFAELVDAPASQKSEPQPEAFRKLRSALRERRFKGKVDFNRIFEVPVMGLKIKAEYAFQNGSLNLVRTRQFSGSPEKVMRYASELAVEGNLIRNHAPPAQQAKLIVVPAFIGDAAALSDQVLDVFKEFEVEAYGADKIDLLVEHIALSAH